MFLMLEALNIGLLLLSSRRPKSAQALNRAKQRRVEEVLNLSEEVSKLSSQNQLLATKLTSLIQKVGNAMEENKVLRKMLSRISEMPGVRACGIIIATIWKITYSRFVL